jgi:hypothetical protein
MRQKMSIISHLLSKPEVFGDLENPIAFHLAVSLQTAKTSEFVFENFDEHRAVFVHRRRDFGFRTKVRMNQRLECRKLLRRRRAVIGVLLE